MARKIRDFKLESRSNRLKLGVRRKPYTGPTLARGIILLYRRNKSNGSWIVKAADGHGDYWTRAFGFADDFEDADNSKILSFDQAQEKARQLARGDATTGAVSDAAPTTLDDALTNYKVDLETRRADPFNALRVRAHLTTAQLAKPVQLFTKNEWKKWRNGLLRKVKPATVNRICKALRAALELAAEDDERITNQKAWEFGLARLPDAEEVRNVILSDAKVSEFVAAAYARDEQLGLLIDTLAVTGTRPSQAVRLRVEYLQASGQQPKLMMLKSAKGGGRNRAERKVQRYSVPITLQLAKRLKAAVKGRASNDLLFMQSNGRPWNADPSYNYARDVQAIVASIGLDPGEVTAYSLRHSSITRMLMKGKPIRLVASLHNTSVGEIERTYSLYITENNYAEDYAREALLEHPAPKPATTNVVPMVTRG